MVGESSNEPEKREGEDAKTSFEVDVEEMKKALMELSKEELAERLAVYEIVIPKLGPAVKWCIQNFFRPVYFRFRLGRENVGLLVGAELIPDYLIFLAEERLTKYDSGKSYVKYDTRLVYAPVKELSFYDVVLEEGKWEEEKSYF